jgi:DNA polymerase-3 subunit epsilon
VPGAQRTHAGLTPLTGSWAFVDLETTGGNPAHNRIIEVAVVAVDDGTIVDEWSRLIAPGRAIPPTITGLTGIDDAMLADAPAFARIRDELLERLRGRTVVAHNARFDYGFLRNEFRREGITFRAPVMCTVRLSRALYPEHRGHGLDALIQRFDLPRDDRHRALGDARAALAFVDAATRDLGAATVTRAIERQCNGPSLPPQLPPDALAGLPHSPGVYLFYGEDDALLYVGKSIDLHDRVRGHLSGDHRSHTATRIAHRLTRIDWQETVGELGALLREASLIKQLQPLHNRRLRKAGAQVIIGLAESADGCFQPAIVPAQDPHAWPGGYWYGPFGDRRAARRELGRIADEHALCRRRLGLEKGSGNRPCFGRQIGRCKGACTGDEAPVRFNMRLLEALGERRIRPWPWSGPIAVTETDPESGRSECHVVDHWRYLGSARDEAEAAEIASDPPAAPFDRDHYRLLERWLRRHPEAAQPLTGSVQRA